MTDLSSNMSISEYLMIVAQAVARRSKCRRKVGCVLADKKGRILSTGYNGAPKDTKNCTIETCTNPPGSSTSCIISIHAEINSLIFCRNPEDIHYIAVTRAPCINCALALMNTNAKILVTEEECPNITNNLLVINSKIENQFWSKVNKLSKNECWEWQGSLYKSGYGSFNFEYRGENTHRVAWKLINGKIEDNLHILHKCDNRKCVNPDHLFLGTHLDNMQDKVLKNRQYRPIGIKNPSCKLTEIDVANIRSEYQLEKPTHSALAHKYNVTKGCITHILNNKTWKE